MQHAQGLSTQPLSLRVVCWGLFWGVSSAWAQTSSVIYRCGQEYTNAPRSAAQCEPVSMQAITVIPGTRNAVLAAVSRKPSPVDGHDNNAERTKTEPPRPMPAAQTERDAQARAIVVQELDKARQQLQQLTQEYNEGEPVKWAAEARNHQKYLDRVAALKAAMARTERDIDSLQRELARRPVVAKTVSP